MITPLATNLVNDYADLDLGQWPDPKSIPEPLQWHHTIAWLTVQLKIMHERDIDAQNLRIPSGWTIPSEINLNLLAETFAREFNYQRVIVKPKTIVNQPGIRLALYTQCRLDAHRICDGLNYDEAQREFFNGRAQSLGKYLRQMIVVNRWIEENYDDCTATEVGFIILRKYSPQFSKLDQTHVTLARYS